MDIERAKNAQSILLALNSNGKLLDFLCRSTDMQRAKLYEDMRVMAEMVEDETDSFVTYAVVQKLFSVQGELKKIIVRSDNRGTNSIDQVMKNICAKANDSAFTKTLVKSINSCGKHVAGLM